ncbi:hypothetical protein AVEN_147224-1 [Araneus ventricosus]|uniref:Uncharacterized protein n=1 Tax=Araneus ventricosus TaxID=182803 RepID=A0A4Y2SI76_ARAVE|nr:hypothetical protein AVEN_147224-1 [Araneus ventricosus]
MFPHIQNSVDENYEEKSSKVHLVKSKKSPNNAKRSSDQNFKENSRDDQSGKSNEVLENVSNVQSGIRKYNSQDNDTKSRKKIRLQENSNTAQPEAKKEQSPIKDESRTPSEDSWPGKPGKKSCIVM